MSPSPSSLKALIEGAGLSLTPSQYDRLWAYHRLLRAANAELNLTRIHNFENMVLKHYVDSLLVLRFTELPAPLLDMGSGPGLPGIPLKIARPNVPMILAESRGARADFLERTCRALGLEGVEVHAGKVGPRFPKTVAGVISRAVAAIPETLDLVAPCLEPGGRMLFMKGPDCDLEIAEAARSQADAFRLVADHAYAIPGTTHERRLVIYERLEGTVHRNPRSSEIAPISLSDRPFREVSSASNPTFRLARDLLTGKGIRKHGQALVAGSKLVDEVLERSPEHALAWISDMGGPPPPESASELTWLRFADPLFRTLDVSGTHAPLLLIRVPAILPWSDEGDWPDGCTLFIPFQDPENIGAVIRSAAAFGVSRVVLLREAAHPFHPKAVRAGGTALLQVPLLSGPSIHELRASRAPLLALSADGEDLAEHPWPDRFGLVAGLEGPGLPESLGASIQRRRIPIEPAVESLNAATATAIALYAWRSVRPSAPPEPGAATPGG